jgi:activator of HSP90 ATPase
MTTKTYSRRKLLAQSIAGSLTLLSGRAFAEAKEITATKAIHQERDYQASPDQIYETLLNPDKFKAFSGGRAAQINREAGGAFSLFDGAIAGRNIELVSPQLIVQAWRAASWPKGIYSVVTFELQPRGSGTRVILDHTGFPPANAEHLASGWDENYWVPLRKYLS